MSSISAGQMERATRRARNIFDKWNEVTGFVQPDTSYYYEILSLMDDAVHCGAQQALGVHQKLESEIDDPEMDVGGKEKNLHG